MGGVKTTHCLPLDTCHVLDPLLNASHTLAQPLTLDHKILEELQLTLSLSPFPQPHQCCHDTWLKMSASSQMQFQKWYSSTTGAGKKLTF
jgi:hypothetical protein